MPVTLFFASILLTCALSGFLALYAWRQRGVPGSRAYAGLALGECLLALAEILSMLSPTPAQALFWFQVRYFPLALIPVFWLVFAVEYSGRKTWFSKRLLAGMFIIPLITEISLWSNSQLGLWARHEVGLHRSGPFWIAETGGRIPGIGFMVHSVYGLILLLVGIVVLLVTAWHIRRQHRGQALLVAGAAVTACVTILITTFNLTPQAEFNPFTPTIGLTELMIALAVFRFQFLKQALAAEAGFTALQAQSQRSLAVVLLIFAAMAVGLTAIAYVSYQEYESQFRRQAESQLSSIATLKVAGLQDWRNERMADAGLVYRNPAFGALVQRYFGNPSDAQAQAELQSWLDHFHAIGEYDWVLLMDVNGVARASAPATPAPVPVHLVRDFAAILSAGQVTFVDFHRDTADGPIHLALLVPILAEQDSNRPLGLLALRIDPNVRLYPFIRQWPVPSNSAETLLVRREGTDVLYLNELKFQSNTALNLRYPLENTQLPAVKAALGQVGTVEGVDYRGVPVIANVRPVSGSPWFMVERQDAAEVYAPLQERLWQTVALYGALIAASGAALGVVWRQQRVRYYRGQMETAEALHKSEQVYRHLFENMLNGFAYCRMFYEDGKPQDFMYLVVNGAFETQTGLKNVAGRRVSEVIPGIQETDQPLLEIYGRVAMTGQPERFETYVKALDLWFSVSVYSPAREHFVAVFDVITERKRAEEALRERNSYIETILENAPIGFAVNTIHDGKAMFVGTKFDEIYGVPHGSMNTVDEYFEKVYLDPVFREQMRERMLTDMASGDAARMRWENIPITTITGEHKVVTAINIPLLDRDLMVSTVQDVTERWQAEEALRESEDKFKYVFDHSVMGKSITLPTGEMSANKALCDMLGYTQEELKRRGWQDVTHPDDIEMTKRTSDRILAGKQDTARFTKRFLHKSGAVVWADLSTSLRRDREGKPLYFVTAASDITESKRQQDEIHAAQVELQRLFAEADQSRRALLSVVEDQKRAEEKIHQLNAELEQRVRDRTAQLQAANKELEAFSYSVSHDLRAPLRAVIGFSAAVLEDYGGRLDAEGQRFLTVICDEARKMGQLIDDLLSFSRIGRQAMATTPINMTSLVESVIDELDPEHAIPIQLDPLPPAVGDRSLLRHVWTNLLSNAYKFTGKNPVPAIHVGGTESESERIYFVKDNGAGFDMRYASKLFGVFQRLHSEADFEGTGIGLSIVQRVVLRHGGRVWAEGEVHEGATFYFALPKGDNP